jgi:DNA mismatch endonuclease (patch repair protein)
MRAVHSTDTSPEMKVRRLLHASGYRYRLHRNDLPGKPDIVLPSRKKVIFVHGCFWHGHTCKRGARTPKTNQEYWVKKIQRNTERDKEHLERLQALGWNTLVIWECEIKDTLMLEKRMEAFLRR